MARGRATWPRPGNIVYAAVRSSGVTSPVPSASDGTSGSPFSPAFLARRSTGPDPSCCCRLAAAAERQEIAGLRIDGHERRLEAADFQPLQPACGRTLGRVLDVGSKRGVHLPVRRMIAAELASELLAQELLRPCGARVGRLAV